MQSSKRRASKRQDQLPPVPTTIWHQLPESHQQQLAHLVAQLMEPRQTSYVRQGAES